MKIKRKLSIWKKLLILFCAVIVLLLLEFISPLILEKYKFVDSDLPSEFNGFKIVQISDFHCKEFGKDEEKLINLVSEAEPDIICLTGDIVDESHPVDNAQKLVEELSKIAPIYYVTGNHEFYSGAPYDEFREICFENNVNILESESDFISRGDAKIKISGLDWQNSNTDFINKLSFADTDYFNILLYHDASKFDFTSAFDYNLLLCGHLHGGLVRLPIIGGIFGSDYLPFPEYDHGLYSKYNSKMIVSSGLGDARIPRWNNPREVVLITLYNE